MREFLLSQGAAVQRQTAKRPPNSRSGRVLSDAWSFCDTCMAIKMRAVSRVLFHKKHAFGSDECIQEHYHYKSAQQRKRGVN
jgi:hypothetical protein